MCNQFAGWQAISALLMPARCGARTSPVADVCRPTMARFLSAREFLSRISVNYLRHQLATYEEQLYEIAGKTGADGAPIDLREMYDGIGRNTGSQVQMKQSGQEFSLDRKSVV